MAKSSDNKLLWSGIAVAVIFVGLGLSINGRPAHVSDSPGQSVKGEPTLDEQLDAASHYILKGEFDSAKKILSRFLLRHPEAQKLPRKFKIAFSGCESDCAFGAIHDIGFIAKVKDGEPGFRVLAGGGLASQPRPAVSMTT